MRIPRFTALLALVVLTAFHTTPRAVAPSSQDRAAGELIVKFKPHARDNERARARGRANGHLKRQHHVGKGTADDAYLEVVTVSGNDLDGAIRRLEADPAVDYAEPNWTYRHFSVPNDPYFGYLWGLHNTGQVIAGHSTGRADADIDALEGWTRATGSSQVYVAVLDEGIDIAHPDLGVGSGGPIWSNPYDPIDGIDNDGNGYVDDRHGWDFAANDASVYDGSPGDPALDSHGTHVAGTIGARANNGIGVTGINWDVRIIPAKFMTPSGGTTDSAIRAIDYIVDLKRRHGLNIVAINASFGSSGYSQAMLEALGRAAHADILFVAAAGNGGADKLGDNNDHLPVYPASYDTTVLAGYDSVISVAATGQADELAQFSNFGDRSVDLAAPGVYILSTTPQNGYSYSSGTSMAAPHVTGAAALLSAATALDGRELRTRLLTAVDNVAALNGRLAGAGRLNVATALGSTPTPTPTPAPVLPSPWLSQDIGPVGAAGRSYAAGGTFTMLGAGADVWGASDALQFAYQPLRGDGTIVARVTTVQNVHAWTKAGVMIRSSLSPASAHAFMLVSPGKGVAFQRRPSEGGVSVHTPAAFSAAPRWVKLTRTASTISAFESADGAAWTAVGTDTIALGETAYVGLAISSHVGGTLAEARFDNVSVTSAPAPATPAPVWSNRDVGSVGLAGSSAIRGGSFTVNGSGADIWNSSDQFHYVYQPLSGDGIIVARVATVQNSNAWVKAGVMIRETLAPESSHAMMIVTPGGVKGLAFQRRVTTGGISTHTTGGSGTAPSWVKLVRSGQTISAYRSSDGSVWTFVGSDTFAMGTSVYVGLAVSSHDNAVLATATFDSVSIVR